MKWGTSPQAVDPKDVERVEIVLDIDKLKTDEIVGMLYTHNGITPQDFANTSMSKTSKSRTTLVKSPKTEFALSVPSNDVQDLPGLYALMLCLQVVPPDSFMPPNPVRQKRQSRALDVLCAFYEQSKSNRLLVHTVSILVPSAVSDNPPVESKCTALVCKAVDGGYAKSRDTAVHLICHFIREPRTKMLVLELLLKKDKKTKGHECVNALMHMMRGKVESAQENAARLVAALCNTPDNMLLLGKKPQMMASLMACVSTGSLRCQEIALGLMWRMTQHDACSTLLAKVENCMDTLMGVLELDKNEPGGDGDGMHPAELWGVREENVLAVMANLAYNEDCTTLVGHNEGALRAAFIGLSFGTDRAKDNGALIIANVSYREDLCQMLSYMHLPLEELVGAMLRGSDRGREWAAMAVANLSRVGKTAGALLCVEGAQQVLMAVRSGSPSKEARFYAEKALGNLGRARMYEKQWQQLPDVVPSCPEPGKGISRSMTHFTKTNHASANDQTGSMQSTQSLYKSLDKGALGLFPSIWSHARTEVTQNFPSLAQNTKRRPFGAFYATAPVSNILQMLSEKGSKVSRSPSFNRSPSSFISRAPSTINKSPSYMRSTSMPSVSSSPSRSPVDRSASMMSFKIEPLEHKPVVTDALFASLSHSDAKPSKAKTRPIVRRLTDMEGSETLPQSLI